MAITPLGNSFLFAFLNETTNGSFVPKNKGRIIIPKGHSQTDLRGQGEFARWAKVLAVGPDVKSFGNGNIVLIEKLRWTQGFEHDGVKIWKSDEDSVLALGEDESVAYDFSYTYE